MIEKSEFLLRKECEYCSLCGRCRQESENNGYKQVCRKKDTTPVLREQIFIQGSELCGDLNPNIDCIYIKNGGLLAIEIKDRQIEYVNKDDREQLKKQLLSVYSSSVEAGLALNVFVLLISPIKNSRYKDRYLLDACRDMFASVGITIDKNNIMHDSRHREHKYAKFEIIRCNDLDKEKLYSLL